MVVTRKLPDITQVQLQICNLKHHLELIRLATDHTATLQIIASVHQSFKKWANPASFCFFVLLKHKFYRKKTVVVSGIRTRIVGVEGEHADHLTTTTAQVSTKVNRAKICGPLISKNLLQCLFKMGHSRPLFFIFVFSIQLTVNKWSI